MWRTYGTVPFTSNNDRHQLREKGRGVGKVVKTLGGFKDYPGCNYHCMAEMKTRVPPPLFSLACSI